jgi:hypothetical protein
MRTLLVVSLLLLAACASKRAPNAPASGTQNNSTRPAACSDDGIGTSPSCHH